MTEHSSFGDTYSYSHGEQQEHLLSQALEDSNQDRSRRNSTVSVTSQVSLIDSLQNMELYNKAPMPTIKVYDLTRGNGGNNLDLLSSNESISNYHLTSEVVNDPMLSNNKEDLLIVRAEVKQRSITHSQDLDRQAQRNSSEQNGVRAPDAQRLERLIPNDDEDNLYDDEEDPEANVNGGRVRDVDNEDGDIFDLERPEEERYRWTFCGRMLSSRREGRIDIMCVKNADQDFCWMLIAALTVFVFIIIYIEEE